MCYDNPTLIAFHSLQCCLNFSSELRQQSDAVPMHANFHIVYRDTCLYLCVYKKPLCTYKLSMFFCNVFGFRSIAKRKRLADITHDNSLSYVFEFILQKWETCETRLADQAQHLEELRARLKQSIPDQQEEMEEEHLLVKVN